MTGGGELGKVQEWAGTGYQRDASRRAALSTAVPPNGFGACLRILNLREKRRIKRLPAAGTELYNIGDDKIPSPAEWSKRMAQKSDHHVMK